MSMLKVEELQRLLRQHSRHQGRLLRGESGRNRDADRRERRGQIHHAEHGRGSAASPRSGSITFEGHDITSTPASKVVSLGLALCPEGRRVFQQMSVRENLEMGGYTRPAGELAASLDQVFRPVSRA